jgi:cytochrome oxidase Cu insertion factor (SCO1/SenC/PrrC family)
MTKTKSLAILSALACGLFVLQFSEKTFSAQAKKDNAPPFTLRLLNGGDFNSSELEGKVTVLKFMASW